MTFENIINSCGVLLFLIAFVLLTLKKLRPEDKAYNLMNFIGAIITCYGSYLIKAIPFVILEGFWGLVALFALIKNSRTTE